VTWEVHGLARGPASQECEVRWGGYESRPDDQVANEMATALHDSFPGFFGCEPTQVEVHIREEVTEDATGVR
jgi:hypothetical protein